MSTPDPWDDATPRRHPLHRRVVAAVAIFALVLSAIGVAIAIAQAQWGPAPSTQTSELPVPA